MWATLLTRLEVLLAIGGVLAAVKSAYNGVLGTVWKNINMIPDMAEQQQEQAATQEKLVDAVVALSIAEEEDGRTIDPRSVENTLRGDGGVRDYLKEDSNGRSPYADVEDEEEVSEEELRWRQEYDDDD